MKHLTLPTLLLDFQHPELQALLAAKGRRARRTCRTRPLTGVAPTPTSSGTASTTTMNRSNRCA